MRVRALHARDLGDGAERVALPTALDRKALAWATELAWQWVFPASRRYRDAASGQERRHHVHETAVQRAMQRAVREAGIAGARRPESGGPAWRRIADIAAMLAALAE